MPFVQAKCPNCGGILAVDNSHDAAVCQFCNTPFIVEKAINNYNITNNISGSTVNIYGGNASDFVIRAGTLEKYVGASTDVVIPDTVAIIGQAAFKDCKALKSVVIPNSVTKIEHAAFQGCEALENINIPNRVTVIEEKAFSNCCFKNISFPESLESINKAAFSGCEALKVILLPPNLKTISSMAFGGCSNLKAVFIPASVKNVGAAFSNCSESLVIFLEGTANKDWKEKIVDEWFSFNYSRDIGRKRVYYPIVENVKRSDFINVFYNNKIDELNTIYAGIYTGDKSITSFAIPNNIRQISDNAFSDCSNLKTVVIPSSVERIGKYAFAKCANLEKVEIPESVKIIDDFAFAECSSLSVVKLPMNALNFGLCPFAGCTQLGSVINWETIKSPYEVFCNPIGYAYKDCSFAYKLSTAGYCIYCGGQLNVFKKCKKCGHKSIY